MYIENLLNNNYQISTQSIKRLPIKFIFVVNNKRQQLVEFKIRFLYKFIMALEKFA